VLTRRFGWTGLTLPAIGQGTWKIEGSREKERQAIEALQTGIEMGATLIDTAEMYGNGRAEELVAEAIRGVRSQIFLVSKVLPWNASYEGTLKACARSLKRLHTDYLDVYLLHWESDHPISETMRALEKLVRDGSIRFFGVSNFDVSRLKEAQAALNNERIACDQVLYHLGDRGIERTVLPYCREEEIAVMAYSPFGSGQFPTSRSRGGRVLSEIGARHKRSQRQVVLNFLLHRSEVFPIPKAGNPEHARENASASDFELSREEMERIDRVFPAPDRDTPLGMI